MFIQLFRSVFKFLLNCGKVGSSLILMGMLLRVVVYESLSWHEQYKIVKGTIYGGLSSLKQLKNVIP